MGRTHLAQSSQIEEGEANNLYVRPLVSNEWQTARLFVSTYTNLFISY